LRVFGAGRSAKTYTAPVGGYSILLPDESKGRFEMSSDEFVVGLRGREKTLRMAMESGAPAHSMFAAAIDVADTEDRIFPKTSCLVLETARRLVTVGNGRLCFSRAAYVRGQNPRAVLANGTEFGVWVGLADRVSDLGILGFEGVRTPFARQSEAIAGICSGAEFCVCERTGDLVAITGNEVAIVFTKPGPLFEPTGDLARDQTAARVAAREAKILL